MGKVGEGDDAAAPDAGGFLQHGFGVAQVLQGVDLQHHVKAVVLKHGQAVFQVELQHVYAPAHAGQHVGIVQLHTVAGAATLALQKIEHGPFAAAQVQHPRPGGNQGRNGLHGGGIAHTPSLVNSVAMFSK